LEKTLSLFCKIARRNSNPAELALTLVDVRVFGFVVARALVTDIERLRKASPNGQLQPNDILNFFIDGQKGESSFGANLLFALEGLVAPPLDVQPLLDAGLLSSLVLVLHRLLSSAVSASCVTAPLTTLDGLKLTDDIGDESRRAMVNSSFELSLD
jgi:hypothetical protein